MPEIPEPDWITLIEARRRALAHFNDAPQDAVERALVSAFWEGKIRTRGRCRTWFRHNESATLGKYVWDPVQVRIGWEHNAFARFSDKKVHTFHNACVLVIDLVRWLGIQRQEGVDSSVEAEPASSEYPASKEPISGSQEHPGGAIPPQKTDVSLKKRRVKYYGELRKYMAAKKPEYLARLDDTAIEQDFRKTYEAAGGSLPAARYVITQIQRIRDSMASGGSAASGKRNG
jgi:hypothetical protein